MPRYTGRFAPSPTGPLHAGSVVAALASWLDARAHGGTWIVRMEDVDEPRCQPEHGQAILHQLAGLGLHPDMPVVWQSQRKPVYVDALSFLEQSGLVYGCACSRKDIETALAHQGRQRARHGELVYPGTCRHRTGGKTVRAWRFACPTGEASRIDWQDRRLGPQQQDVAAEVGDFVVLRADGCFAYQLAVVVDDASQGVTHVVRGEDLADNTARQILLQKALGLPTPRYLHTPLVLAADGQKLSKQNGAAAIDTSHPVQTLQQAAQALGLPAGQPSDNTAGLAQWLAQAVAQWHDLYNPTP